MMMCLLHDIFNVVRHINDPPRKRKKNRIRFYCCRIFIALGGWVLLLLLLCCVLLLRLWRIYFLVSSFLILSSQFQSRPSPTAHHPKFFNKKNYSDYNSAHTHYTSLHLLIHFIILRFLVVVPCIFFSIFYFRCSCFL